MNTRLKLYATVLLASTIVTSAGLGSPSSAAAEPAGYALTMHSTVRYRLPDDVLNARRECFRAEREARGIPGNTAAYVAWWNVNAGTAARADWSAAFDACNAAHPLPGGPWNWAAMVRVR